MKPIIIGITQSGKVDMSLDEFRKHMDEAYWQGYRDNTSSLTSTNGNTKWWDTQPYFNLCGETSNKAEYSATSATNGKEG